MAEWHYAQSEPSQQLALLHFFSVKKNRASGDVEFRITVHEYFTPPDPAMLFFAQADKQVNQNAVPFTPSGWGRTLLEALSECVKAIHSYPYDEPRT